MNPGSWQAQLLALGIGSSVGLSELLSRYNWSFRSILSSPAGWGYLGINGAVSVLAYKVGVDWGIAGVLQDKPEYWRVGLVSIGAMFFLRSALAQVRFGNHEVGLGLVTILEIFSRRAERRLDQVVTRQRWQNVQEVCSRMTYNATRQYLVAVSEVALASQDEREREAFRKNVSKIEDMPVDDETRMRLLAMVLADMLGQDLFHTIATEASVRLEKRIKDDRSNQIERDRQLAELKVHILTQTPERDK